MSCKQYTNGFQQNSRVSLVSAISCGKFLSSAEVFPTELQIIFENFRSIHKHISSHADAVNALSGNHSRPRRRRRSFAQLGHFPHSCHIDYMAFLRNSMRYYSNDI